MTLATKINSDIFSCFRRCHRQACVQDGLPGRRSFGKGETAWPGQISGLKHPAKSPRPHWPQAVQVRSLTPTFSVFCKLFFASVFCFLLKSPFSLLTLMNTVKVSERVRFWHGNVHLLANHSSALLSRRAVIGREVYIFMLTTYTFRDFDSKGGTDSSKKSKFVFKNFKEKWLVWSWWSGWFGNQDLTSCGW